MEKVSFPPEVTRSSATITAYQWKKGATAPHVNTARLTMDQSLTSPDYFCILTAIVAFLTVVVVTWNLPSKDRFLSAPPIENLVALKARQNSIDNHCWEFWMSVLPGHEKRFDNSSLTHLAIEFCDQQRSLWIAPKDDVSFAHGFVTPVGKFMKLTFEDDNNLGIQTKFKLCYDPDFINMVCIPSTKLLINATFTSPPFTIHTVI
jgi:hypothetical protein